MAVVHTTPGDRTPQRSTTNTDSDLEFVVVFTIVLGAIVLCLMQALTSARAAAEETQARSEALQAELEAAAMEAITGKPARKAPARERDAITVAPPSTTGDAFDIPWTAIGIGVAGAGALSGAVVGGTALQRSVKRRRDLHAAARERWNLAAAKHDAIADEYAHLRLDTDTALSHATLWDVADPRTEAFTLAYGKVADTRRRHAATPPVDPAVVTEYVTQVDTAHLAWTQARDHALAESTRAARKARTAARTRTALAPLRRLLG
jgi:hypothetical protein